MLGKLLKYDLKWIYKVVGVFYVLAFIFSVLGRVISQIEDSLVFLIITKVLFGFAIAMIINSLVNCMMRLWVRFIRNIYKDESYLTHTLPVSKTTIYESKIIATIICVFTTMVVSVVCLFICYYSKENIEALKGLLEIAATTYNTTVVKFLLLIIFAIFLEIIYIMLVGYVGIIFGYKSNRNKMLNTLLVGFVSYMAMQVLTLGIMYVIALFSPDIMNLFNTVNVVDIDIIKNVMYIAIGIYSAYIFIIYIVGNKALKKGVNVD